MKVSKELCCYLCDNDDGGDQEYGEVVQCLLKWDNSSLRTGTAALCNSVIRAVI